MAQSEKAKKKGKPGPNCPYCDEPTVLRVHTEKMRRGDMSFPVKLKHWECANDCPMPGKKDKVYTHQDGALQRYNSQAITDMWKLRRAAKKK